MKVGIYGAGGMGTVLGAFISKAGYEIDLINRNKEHVDALNNIGAQIIGKVNFIQKVKALLPSEMNDKYDIILLMTKQRYNKEIVESIKPHLHEKSLICTMQNGLPEKVVSEIIGEDRTCGCAMSWGATFHGNGISELTSEPIKENLTFSIGKYGNNDPILFSYIVEMLKSMGEVTIEDNFIGARWAKLLINSAFSGLSVITDSTFGEIAKNKKTKVLALEVIKECIDVARAANIKIEPLQGKDIVKYLDYDSNLRKWISLKLLTISMKRHQLIKSSMLRDLRKNRKTEIDFINGVVCDFGKQYKVDTPINDKIIEVVHQIEDKKLIPTWENIKYFKEFF
jgi:2-dehydropantoate 2-reductase